MKKEKGFTLIELLIVVAIIGIVAAIAMMNSQALSANYKVKGAANQIFSDMQRARLTAIKNGRAWCVIFNGAPAPASFTGYVVVDAGANGTCDSGVDVVDTLDERSVDLSSSFSGVTMTHNFSAAPAGTLNFNPNGTATAGAAGAITLTGTNGRTVQVTVNQNTGRVSIL